MTIEKKQTILRQAIKDFNEIKQSIVDSGVEVLDDTPTASFDEKIAEVRNAGHDEGYEVGVEQGKADEQRAFWEAYQQNGERRDYANAFAGRCWTDEIYNPIYPIDVSGQVTAYVSGMFSNSYLTDTKVEIIAKGAAIQQICMSTALRIFRIVVDENTTYGTSMGWGSPFYSSRHIVELYISGTIAHNYFNVQWQTNISHDSIVSIINALSSTTTDLTVTLSLNAVNNAFETESGLADGSTSQEWLELVATKSNWTISLV